MAKLLSTCIDLTIFFIYLLINRVFILQKPFLHTFRFDFFKLFRNYLNSHRLHELFFYFYEIFEHKQQRLSEIYFV